jgi:hypothetical protein
MHKVTFFPLGNADSCRIDLSGGKKILFDFAAMKDPKDKADLRIDLPKVLRRDLEAAKRDSFDVVSFTHLDDDHIRGSSEFFYLEHASKYQDGDRIKIAELWVPAAAVVEEGCEDEARIIRTEARYRLKEGKGIRVFSRPELLKGWLAEQGLSLESRKHLITDAGQLIPGFTLAGDGIEFFVHAPFASRLDDGSVVDRNNDSSAVQATMFADGKFTKLLLLSDLDYEALTDIVKITKAHKRESRLEWDLSKLPHHCSYTALGPEKGKEKTKPVEEVAWLFETQAQSKATTVATCKPIPSNDDDNQPPHRQAAKYHRDTAADRAGEFIVTMEHPKTTAPDELVVEIGSSKAKVKLPYAGAAGILVSRSAPRAGSHV